MTDAPETTSTEEAVKEPTDFPAETGTNETAAPVVEDEGRKPWFPALVGKDGTFKISDTDATFKTQALCDEWIKANIDEDEILISLRIGKKFAMTRKVTEVA